MKNILILEDSSKAGFGGGQKITLDVIDVVKNDFHLYVFDCSDDSLFVNKVKESGIKTIKLKCYSKVSKYLFVKYFEFIMSIFYLIQNIFLIYIFLKNHNIVDNSLIYVTTKKGLILAYFLKKIFEIDFVYHAHMIENPKIQKLIGFLTKNAYKIICVSQIVAEQYNYKNIEVVLNAVDIFDANSKTIKNKQYFVVATISSLNYIKGIEYFIKSYDYLENTNSTFYIYGDGPLRDSIKLSDSKNMHLKGHISNVKEVLLNKVDILVVPTIIPESFGMVILEAFSCGVPVIATNIGMQGILVTESRAGELVGIKNSKEIAIQIDKILSDEKKYEEYSKNGLEYVKKFDKQIFNNQIKKVFREYDITNK